MSAATARPTTLSSVLFAVRAVPIDAFGERHGRQTRKLVLLTLASYANSDGTQCFPSVSKIAENCGLQKRSVQMVLAWLRDHGFLEIGYKAGPNQSNMYTILIPEVVNSSIHDEGQHSSCTEAPGVVNSSVHGGDEGKHTGGEFQSSPNLHMDQQLPTKRPTNAHAPKSGAPFVLPSWIPYREWNDFEQMRRKIRKPMTDRARELIVLKLAKLRDDGDPPVEVLNQSIASGWQGVFALTRDQRSRKPAAPKPSVIDYAASFGFAPGQNVGRLR